MRVRHVLLRGTQRKIRAQKRSLTCPQKTAAKRNLGRAVRKATLTAMKIAVKSPESDVYQPLSGASHRNQIPYNH